MGLIAVFDFDGTIIKKDSLMLFFRQYFKLSWKTLPSLFNLSFYSLKFFLKLYSQKQIKEKLINLAISASQIKNLDITGTDFAVFMMGFILPDARKEIAHFEAKGYDTVLLSASPDFYLKHISSMLGFSCLICTKTEIKNGSIIIKGDNCYGENKVKMLIEKYKNNKIDWDKSYCFADNKSDLSLLKLFGNSFIVNNKKIASKVRSRQNKGSIKFLEWN